MTSNADIQQHLQFLDFKENNLVGYRISNNANGDEWSDIVVVFNGNTEVKVVDLPKGKWTVIGVNGILNEEGIKAAKGGKTPIAKHSALILKQ